MKNFDELQNDFAQLAQIADALQAQNQQVSQPVPAPKRKAYNEDLSGLAQACYTHQRSCGEAKDFLENYPEFRVVDYSSFDHETEQGYETWVKFLLLSHYGGMPDSEYAYRGNARYLVEKYLPKYDEASWEIEQGSYSSTFLLIDTQSELWEDLFEELVGYVDYPSIGHSEDWWWQEESDEKLEGMIYYLDGLDLGEKYEWIEEFGSPDYKQRDELQCFYLDPATEGYDDASTILYEVECEHDIQLEVGFQYRDRSETELREAVVEELLKLGRVRLIPDADLNDECEGCGAAVAASGLDDYGNCPTCQFLGGCEDD